MLVGIGDPKQLLDCSNSYNPITYGANIVSNGSSFIAVSGVTGSEWSPDLPPQQVAAELGAKVLTRTQLCG